MEKSLALIFKYFGLAMALVFVFAIVLGIIGGREAVLLAQIGIGCAICIPVVGVAFVTLTFFRARETKYAVCAIILLILLAITTVWRIVN